MTCIVKSITYQYLYTWSDKTWVWQVSLLGIISQMTISVIYKQNWQNRYKVETGASLHSGKNRAFAPLPLTIAWKTSKYIYTSKKLYKCN